MDAELRQKFSGCMRGRTMYVVPYSMGPVDSPLAQVRVHHKCFLFFLLLEAC